MTMQLCERNGAPRRSGVHRFGARSARTDFEQKRSSKDRHDNWT